ncbi:MAG: hypothetical protein KDD55_00315 [Bdellovibrionales bacterium]|nr:hypothetical protein [Bdellovibrionales bacterium]
MKLRVILVLMLLALCQSVSGQVTIHSQLSWEELCRAPIFELISSNAGELEHVTYERDTFVVIDGFEMNKRSALSESAKQSLRDLIETHKKDSFLVYVAGLTDEATRSQFNDNDNALLEDQLAESRARVARDWLERHAPNWDCRLSPIAHFDQMDVRGIVVQIWKAHYSPVDRSFQEKLEGDISDTQDDVSALKRDVERVEGSVSSIIPVQLRAGVGIFGFTVPHKFGVRAPGFHLDVLSGRLGVYGSLASTRSLDRDLHYAFLSRLGMSWQLTPQWTITGGFLKGKWVNRSPGNLDTASGGEVGFAFLPIKGRHLHLELGGSYGYYDVVSDREAALAEGILHYGEKQGSYGGVHFRLLLSYTL